MPRHLPVCSVDPPGCKDIDDALHVRRLPNGNWEVRQTDRGVCYGLATGWEALPAQRQVGVRALRWRDARSWVLCQVLYRWLGLVWRREESHGARKSK